MKPPEIGKKKGKMLENQPLNSGPYLKIAPIRGLLQEPRASTRFSGKMCLIRNGLWVGTRIGFFFNWDLFRKCIKNGGLYTPNGQFTGKTIYDIYIYIQIYIYI